ncbi:glycosyltransferase family 4 protein [Fodinibius salinus]|uniref:glycosyltransferase family 4 protein n=1 Tax=Fodinibius salinus TaxID=860790 RepID=UPI00147864E5|nr:glycosyltransferase family 4 protein [Fodinibius salinus]
MRVLILTNAYPSEEKEYAGIFVKNHVDWFRKNTDMDVSVFSIKRSFTGLLGSIKKYLMSFLRFFMQLRKQYDVLHLHFLSPLLLLTFIYKLFHPSTTVFLTMHGSDINNLQNTFLIRFYRELIGCVDRIICVGQSMEEVVKQKLNRDVDHFLCAGINTADINPLGNDYNERDIDFLYVGSFYKVKGTDKLIEALQEIGSEDLNVVFIGSGNYQEEIKALENQVNLTVLDSLTQKEINQYYNRSKFFIFPSRSEGFGLSLAEAMYCGTPGIISNLEQLKYQVRNDHNGFVCEASTSDELGRLIKKAYNISAGEWAELSQNAMKSAKKYTIDHICKTLEKLYLNTRQ